MKKIEVTREMSRDELVTKIMDAMCESDLRHDEAIALGDNPHRTALVLEALQTTGVIEAYCGPIQPSTCRYKLAEKL